MLDIPCERCPKPAASVCCSSHNKSLCHLCYRQTHFVGKCVEGCKQCAAEGLPVLLRDESTTRRTDQVRLQAMAQHISAVMRSRELGPVLHLKDIAAGLRLVQGPRAKVCQEAADLLDPPEEES